MAAPPLLALCLTCVFWGETAQTGVEDVSSADRGAFASAAVGAVLTLRCRYEPHGSSRLYWYKQTAGERPELVAVAENERSRFEGKFKDDSRLAGFIQKGEGGLKVHNLRIASLRVSDSATYYCVRYMYSVEFLRHIVVRVDSPDRNSNTPVIPEPGGPAAPSCPGNNRSDGEHHIYWLQESEGTHPGVVYTQRGPEGAAETLSCLYHLPTEDLEGSHGAGSSDCAVATCGRMLFGSGTRLDFEYDGVFLVYLLTGVSSLTTFLSVLLALLVCVMSRRSWTCAGSHTRIYTSSKTESFQNGDNVPYVALKMMKRSKSQMDDTWSECVYFSVKQ